MLAFPTERILRDLQFRQEQLAYALLICKNGIASPSDVWKLQDYLEQKLIDLGKNMISFTMLSPERNHWFSYQKHGKPCPKAFYNSLLQTILF
ncbi:DUF2316 family protein [Faecalimonas umbilicata]|uniref:DUF2316 family protein n=1 Tax=Faecalimonas umbilicata TaxID=1912855 RepID=UPI003FA5ACD1